MLRSGSCRLTALGSLGECLRVFMSKAKPLTNAAGEVRELSAADMALFKPVGEVLPADWLAKHVRRGKQKAPTKVPTTIRFDADVLQAIKGTGRGWQTRVNDALRDWAKAQRLTA